MVLKAGALPVHWVAFNHSERKLCTVPLYQAMAANVHSKCLKALCTRMNIKA